MNNEGTEEGSLLKLLNRCVTPFGKRLFRIWLCLPLKEISAINARQDAVQDILSHPTYESTFTEVAKGLPDLERIVSRVHAKNCKIKDFLNVLKVFLFLYLWLSCFTPPLRHSGSSTREWQSLLTNRKFSKVIQLPDY